MKKRTNWRHLAGIVALCFAVAGSTTNAVADDPPAEDPGELNFSSDPAFVDVDGKRYIFLENTHDDQTVEVSASPSLTLDKLWWEFEGASNPSGKTEGSASGAPMTATYKQDDIAGQGEFEIKFSTERTNDDDQPCTTTDKVTARVVMPELEINGETEATAMLRYGNGSYLVSSDIVTGTRFWGAIFGQTMDPQAPGGFVKSNKGVEGEKHFVTIKGSGDVEIKVKGVSSSADFDKKKLKWSGAGTNDSGKNHIRKISRATPGKYTIELQDGHGERKDKINVWVVWSTFVPPAQKLQQVYQGGQFVYAPRSSNALYAANPQYVGGHTPMKKGIVLNGGYWFHYAIEPPEITDSTKDIPDLTGANVSSPPGGAALSGGANAKWDNARQMQRVMNNPAGIAKVDMGQPAPVASISYPSTSTPLVANDDASANYENNNPYVTAGSNTKGHIGEIDVVKFGLVHDSGTPGDTLSVHAGFLQFTRLEINGEWHIISDKKPWRIHFKFKKVGTQWQDDGSFTEVGNDGI